MNRRYRVVWVRDDKGTRGVHCHGPFTHEEACTILRKLAPQPWRRDMVEEIVDDYPAKCDVCGKCGKRIETLDEITNPFRVCFCGIRGQRLFHTLFPQYANMQPRQRRSRTRRPRAACGAVMSATKAKSIASSRFSRTPTTRATVWCPMKRTQIARSACKRAIEGRRNDREAGRARAQASGKTGRHRYVAGGDVKRLQTAPQTLVPGHKEAQ
jgi:hypothetical protein